MEAIKCNKCGKCFIRVEGESKCPYCKKDYRILENPFKDTPFENIFKEAL
jgi:phage FluMu protein Com